MYQNNVGSGPDRKGFHACLLKRLVNAYEWLHFRQRGVLFMDDLFPRRRRDFKGLPGAEITEEQRQEKIEEIRRRPRIG